MSTVSQSYRSEWGLGFGLIVIADTLLTAAAVDAGLGVEGNPLIAGLVHGGGYLELAVLKLLVMLTVYGVWRYSDPGRADAWVPKYAAGAGVFIVAWNLLNISLALAFG